MKEANYADLLPITQHVYSDSLKGVAIGARCWGESHLGLGLGRLKTSANHYCKSGDWCGSWLKVALRHKKLHGLA